MMKRLGYSDSDVRSYADNKVREVEDSIGPIVDYLRAKDIVADITWRWSMVIPKSILEGDDFSQEADDFLADVSTEIDGRMVNGVKIESYAGDNSGLEKYDDNSFIANWLGTMFFNVIGESNDPSEDDVKEIQRMVDDYASDLDYITVDLFDSGGDHYIELQNIG